MSLVSLTGPHTDDAPYTTIRFLDRFLSARLHRKDHQTSRANNNKNNNLSRSFLASIAANGHDTILVHGPHGKRTGLNCRTPGARFSEVPKTFRVFFKWYNSLCIFKTKAFRDTKLCSYLNFYSLYNVWKDQLHRIGESEFYEWLFGLEKPWGLSRNGPQAHKILGLKYCSRRSRVVRLPPQSYSRVVVSGNDNHLKKLWCFGSASVGEWNKYSILSHELIKIELPP